MKATATNPPEKKKAPWRGRKRVPDAKGKFIAVRCTLEQREIIQSSAGQAGLSVGAFLRAVALGDAGPRAVRKAPADRLELAKLLAAIGKLGSNVNQMARLCNTFKAPPGQREMSLMQADIAAMRQAVMQALGRGD